MYHRSLINTCTFETKTIQRNTSHVCSYFTAGKHTPTPRRGRSLTIHLPRLLSQSTSNAVMSHDTLDTIVTHGLAESSEAYQQHLVSTAIDWVTQPLHFCARILHYSVHASAMTGTGMPSRCTTFCPAVLLVCKLPLVGPQNDPPLPSSRQGGRPELFLQQQQLL